MYVVSNTVRIQFLSTTDNLYNPPSLPYLLIWLIESIPEGEHMGLRLRNIHRGMLYIAF
jgi:hypothetical protein